MNNASPRSIIALAILAMVSSLVLAQDEPSAKLLISNVNLWDGQSESMQSGVNVLIENEVFAQISPDPIAAEGATVIDGSGLYMVPGFIDLHTHFCLQAGPPELRTLDQMGHGALAAGDLKKQLEAGFTTARDAGCNTQDLASLILEGRLDGPRLFSSGPWIGPTGGHSDFGFATDLPGDTNYAQRSGVGHVVDGRAEVLRAVRSNFRNGATQVKLMVGGGISSEFDPLHINEFTIEELQAAVQIAQDYDSYILVHSYTDTSMNRAMDAGVRVIEHGFLGSEKTFKRMAKEGVAWSLQAFASTGPVCAPETISFWNADQKQKALKVCEGAKSAVSYAKKHKVFIGLGGDLFGPSGMPYINENIVVPVTEFGFTPLEAMRMATVNAGEIVSWSGEMNPYKAHRLGVISEDAWGDAVLLDGNPLEDITMVRPDHIEAVIKGGVVYKSD
jgi:imidazolonepropionase-like amidohydrolase